jgi:hypothetical protein
MRGPLESNDLDPEALADLQRRAASERDPQRTREAARPVANDVAAKWLCRRCRTAMVDVSAHVVHGLEVSNRELQRRGEPPIPTHQVVFCETCTPIARKERAARIAREAAESAALIRELNSLIDNDLREASIAARLRELGHDVPALLREARNRRAEKRRATATGPRRNNL